MTQTQQGEGENNNVNGYICFYRGKRLEVHAATTLAAQTEAARRFKARRTFEVSVHLAELGGKPYVNVAVN